MPVGDGRSEKNGFVNSFSNVRPFQIYHWPCVLASLSWTQFAVALTISVTSRIIDTVYPNGTTGMDSAYSS